ncbi:MAG: hypothetical protein VB068_13365 [Petrimonas sp.]|nr:hypothetical protein [Petrimonas sp.]
MIKRIFCDNFIYNNDTKAKWEKIDSDFQEWEKSISGRYSSALCHKTFLAEKLYNSFPEIYDNFHCNIDNILLKDFHGIGESVSFSGTNYIILNRTITQRGGILLTLQTSDMKIITHEFFE